MPDHHPTVATASRVVRQVFEGAPLEPISFLGEGTLNVVFAAHLPGGRFAVRLCRDGHDDTACAQEAEHLHKAALCGVPVPQVHTYGVSEGQPFLIETLAPGVSGDTPGSDTLWCWQQLGVYARRVHDISLPPTCNRLTADGKQAFEETTAPAEWRRFLSYSLASLTPSDPLLALGVYSLTERDAVQEVFQRLQTQSFRFGLNHNDLDPRHLFVASSGEATLIDWGCAEINLVPHYDLAEILRWHLPDSPNVRAFCQGYGLSDADFALLLPQVRDFQLLKSFDLVRWAIDQRPDQIPTYAERARTTLVERATNASTA